MRELSASSPIPCAFCARGGEPSVAHPSMRPSLSNQHSLSGSPRSHSTPPPRLHKASHLFPMRTRSAAEPRSHSKSQNGYARDSTMGRTCNDIRTPSTLKNTRSSVGVLTPPSSSSNSYCHFTRTQSHSSVTASPVVAHIRAVNTHIAAFSMSVLLLSAPYVRAHFLRRIECCWR